jgi:outer membrane protein OmpA-like peptidoglycan-associated protein
MKNYILTVILACITISIQAQTSTGIHHIKYLEINTANSDYSVDFIDNDRVVFATSTTSKVVKSKKFQPHLDLYEGEMSEEGQILNKSRSKGIQTKKITKTGATFASDKKTVYFSAKKYTKRKSKKPSKSDLYKADINENGEWVNMVKLPFNTSKNTIESPSLNSEGTKLYFSADLPGTLGGKDIFIVTINSDGTYTEPRNLGNKVNTNKDEITPFIADNSFLYYSSNGKANSLGSFDIYLSEAFDNTVSESLHLDSPINSINDDFAYIVKSDKGYFSSNRLQGQDNNDIYSFYIEPDKPVECFQQVLGTVRDKETEKILPGATISVLNDEGKEVDVLTTDENGNYSYNLGCRDTFTFRASKKDYSVEEHIINTANYTEAPSLEVNQSLTYNYKEVEDKVVINVNPIYFGFDKWNINNSAATELDKIVKIMKENTDLMIESASHTDSRGTKSYNQILSERRAKATVDYIVARGIDASRINSKGYGESKLLNNCSDGVRCKVEDHKFNRRTEFIIMNKQTNSYKRVATEKDVLTSVPEKVIPKEATEIDTVIIEDAVSLPENNDTDINIVIDEIIDDSTAKEEKASTNGGSSPLNSTINSVENEVPEGSILNKMDMIKDFKNPSDIEVENKIESQEIETQTIYTTLITIADNQEIDNSKENLNKSVQKNDVINPDIIRRTNVIEDIPDRRKIASGEKTETNYPTTNNQKEEAFLNASSSSFNQSDTTNARNNDSSLTYNTKKISKNSVSKLNDSTLNTIPESVTNEDIAFTNDLAVSESSSTKSNMSNLSFDDEDEGDLTQNRFSGDLSDKITITDYDKEAKDKPINNNILIAKQQQQFKQAYSSNVKNLKKEEVLSIKAIDVTPITINKKGRYLATINWKKVDVMRINFRIDNNKYITAGYKEVYILIQNPSGTILNRKGKFKVNNGKELTYTEKTNAYYNKNHLNISMVTDRFIQKITKGIYTITIYIEGYPVGLEMVELT